MSSVSREQRRERESSQEREREREGGRELTTRLTSSESPPDPENRDEAEGD